MRSQHHALLRVFAGVPIRWRTTYRRIPSSADGSGIRIAEEFSASRFGPRSTVLTDQFGNPVDGTHLDRACQELKLFCPRVVQHFDSEIEKHQVALALNCNRGFASRKAKRKLIANYLLKDPGINDRNLSELVAVFPEYGCRRSSRVGTKRSN